MKNIHETHQLFFFSKNIELSTVPADISKVLSVLTPFGLIPTINNEFDIFKTVKKQFLSMIHIDESMRVEFPSSGIVISKDGGTLKDFVNLALSILKALNTLFPLARSNRLSLVNNKFFAGSEEQFQEVYERIFTYKSVSPIEWENRIVLREDLSLINEKINKVSTIRRGEVRSQFINQSEPTDVIMFEIDTNTLPTYTDTRFDLSNAEEIYKDFSRIHSELFEELKRYE
ncbi:hypothetical protein POD11_10560 [Acinetobacter sp. P1(2023)]|uniref:hypothetical protein n=1 Tax=unclassified Acinetobacter TaxID=196816 RepID=UPI0021CDB406|nr:MULTISPECIES: hypothetical protein [unclassified Acinetobacter]MCU4530617.1 hypothetical protein [Acinetobacter sp. WU_MDCI_Abxe169]MDC0842699.1 hypothetical protein [Acinetobacter sp. P1(2023)]